MSQSLSENHIKVSQGIYEATARPATIGQFIEIGGVELSAVEDLDAYSWETELVFPRTALAYLNVTLDLETTNYPPFWWPTGAGLVGSVFQEGNNIDLIVSVKDESENLIGISGVSKTMAFQYSSLAIEFGFEVVEQNAYAVTIDYSADIVNSVQPNLNWMMA